MLFLRLGFKKCQKEDKSKLETKFAGIIIPIIFM